MNTYEAIDSTGYSEQIEADTVDDAIEIITREWAKYINAPVSVEIYKMNLTPGGEIEEAFDEERTQFHVSPITQSAA